MTQTFEITQKISNLIGRALRKAKQSEDETLIAENTGDAMIVKIWYRTIGDENVLIKYEVVTAEQWAWEQAGCKNNKEWHAYLNKMLWRENAAGLKR